MATAEEISQCLDERVDDAAAVADLRTYFGGKRYEGRRFELYDQGGDRPEVANHFTAADIVALTSLSVRVGPNVSWRILHDDADELADLLAKVPRDADLWEVDQEVVQQGQPASDLWGRIRRMSEKRSDNSGRRRATAYKLLARKRPRLLPVYDNIVRRVLRLEWDENCWVLLREALSDASLRQRIAQCGQDAGVPEGVSLLRTLDVILWMYGDREFGKLSRR
ncbi:MAG: DUF6308 family protein [Mycobacteriales bacterium]